MCEQWLKLHNKHSNRLPLVTTTRNYSPADREALLGFIVDFQNYERAMEPSYVSGEDMAEQYLEKLTSEGQLILVEVDGVPAGFIHFENQSNDLAFCSTSGTDVYITDLYVSPVFRKRGLSKILVMEAEKYCYENGHSSVSLSVLARSKDSRAVYEKLGFREYSITMTKTIRI